jgi:hypothetical protein
LNIIYRKILFSVAIPLIPAMSNIKVVEVTFSVEAYTEFGDQLLVVGNIAALGCWQPEKGMAMHTDKKSVFLVCERVFPHGILALSVDC